MADLIAKFMALQEVEETVYVSDKPWTYKPRVERASAKPHWNGRPFGRSHETPGRAMGGVGGKYTTGGSVEAVTTPTGKQTSLPSGSHPDNTPSTQGRGKGRIGLPLAGDVTIVGSMGTLGRIAQGLSRL